MPLSDFDMAGAGNVRMAWHEMSGHKYCPLIQTLDAAYRARAKCHVPEPNFRAHSRAGAGIFD